MKYPSHTWKLQQKVRDESLIDFTLQVTPACTIVDLCLTTSSAQGHPIVDLIPERWEEFFINDKFYY